MIRFGNYTKFLDNICFGPTSLCLTLLQYLLETNKLFVNMDKSVPVQVKLESFIPGLYLRALPVFVRDDDLKDSVRRCFIHVAVNNPSNNGYENILDHVIRCKDPAAVYDYNATSGRYSVVVPVRSPSSGTDTVTVLYTFMCKTSCIGGMNRRPIEVIFTLEYDDYILIVRKVKTLCPYGSLG